MPRERLPVYGVAAAVAIAGYAALNHYVTAYHPDGSFAVWLPLAPVAVASAAVAWRSRWRYPLLGLGAALLASASLWPDRWAPGDKLLYAYLAEHVGINALLGWGFGRSLRAGCEPLCARMARSVHGALPPEVAAYARSVTVAWTVFFGAIIAISLLLFFFASIDTWSIFANFVNLPAVVAMFVIEYRIRLRALPDFQHVSILTGVRSFMATSRPGETAAETGQG